MNSATGAWINNLPESYADRLRLLKAKKHLLTKRNRFGKALRQILKQVNIEQKDKLEQARAADPLRYFKPSYDQALLLNAWMYGIAFLCVYTANRIGKTTALIVNNILYIFPNKPEWQERGAVFYPYYVGQNGYDDENKGNRREGLLVQVFPRPNAECVHEIFDYIKKKNLKPDLKKQFYEEPNRSILTLLQKKLPHCYTPCFPYAPINRGGEIWMGAPDHKHHKKIIMPLWKKYLPKSCIERDVPSDQEMTFKVVGEKKTTYWEWLGKSYDSEDTKWSSGAVDIIHLTEGITQSRMNEVNARFKDPAFGGHDFTPYEAANTGPATALAKKVLRGKIKFALPQGVWEGFTIYDAPLHIVSKKKKQNMIETYKGSNEAAARLEGRFWTSSLLVLDNADRKIHLLPWTWEETKQRFPTGRLYRGIDPGKDHPTACAWGLLTPQNQWIIYRFFSQRGLDIPTRCQKIIQLSNNSQRKIIPNRNRPDLYYQVEVHDQKQSEIYSASIADYHMFKEDEVTGLAYALNYTIEGLSLIESTHMGPEDRALKLNGQLKPSPYRPALQSLQRGDPVSAARTGGAGVYFLRDEPGIMQAWEIWEEFYWQRYRSGDMKGMPKDQVPSHDDDELDGVCYLTCSNYVWTSAAPRARVLSNKEERNLEHAAEQIRKRQLITQAFSQQDIVEQEKNWFATIAKKNRQRETVFFGGNKQTTTTEESDNDNILPLQSDEDDDDNIDFTRFD